MTILTTEEKRELLYEYCENTNCKDCKLNTGNWKKLLFGEKHPKQQCLFVAISDDEEIDKAVALISKEV